MRKTTEIPKDKIGAFVGHMPTSLAHPDEDRYLTVREALSIMKLPNDVYDLGERDRLGATSSAAWAPWLARSGLG